MKKDPESIFKKGLRSVAASVPVAASLSQWWAEMDSDAQNEAIEELREQVSGLRNPIMACHPRAPELLAVFYKRIEETGERRWPVDDELREFLEVLSLWEKQSHVQVQHAIGNRWISVRLSEPLFIMAVYNAVKGDIATAKLRHAVWEAIKSDGKGVQGQPIAETLGVPLLYVDALFHVLEAEGKGWKSKTIGSSYFSPDPALCK
jgi:hypothetical protein